jgi:hypothetical protein
MRLSVRQRRTLNMILCGALILGQLAGFVALPRPAQAALSADPNAEIIYIDDNGVIRVLDTEGDPRVEWFSPTGSWDQIVLMDVTGDGDMEILALDDIDDNNLRISVFDPVLAMGATDPSKQINGIPWDELWTTTIQGRARFVVGGDFDPGIPGDEIAVGFRRGDTTIIQIYNASSLGADGRPTGRDWKIHIEKEFPGINYRFGVAAQLDEEGADELVLIGQEGANSQLDVYRPDQDMFRADQKRTDSDVYQSVVAGQLSAGGGEELAVILSSEKPNRVSLRTFKANDKGGISTDESWAFAPNPEAVFLADIRGNGDKEVLFLRNYPRGQEGARLIMRDEWGNDQRQNRDLIEWKLMNGGSNNEFRAGAGGDVDGDGRDEIILLRNDRIRIYHRPETGNEGTSDFNDYMLPTDNKRINLLVADLDRNGFTTGPILQVSGNMIDAIVPSGSVSQEFTVNVQNVGTDGGVGISAIVPPGNGWVQLNPTFATTPATFRVRFNASGLQPGNYSTTMTLVASGSNVTNNNFVVYLNLTVIPPKIEPNPPIVSLYRFPCATDPCSEEEIAERNEPFTTTIELNGSTDLAFRAAVLGVPPQGGDSVTAATLEGLAGPITRGEIDANGNIVIFDDHGNSRTLVADEVSASATHTTTVMLDPHLTWITAATLDRDVVPADLSLQIDPSILTERSQREYAVVILVADSRAGTPNGNVTLIPVELANVGFLMWAGLIANE